MSNIEQMWTKLEDEAKDKNSTGIQRIRIMPESKFNIFLGYEKPKNRRILLIVLSRHDMREKMEYPKSKGFEVQSLSLPEDTSSINLELILTDPRFKDVFTCLVDDTLDQIKMQKNESSMVKIFINRLITWQQFFDQYDPEGLSEEAQRGLYGELWVLRKYMIPLLGIREGVESWQGPNKKQQDFRVKDNAVEVKTTISKEHQKIQIASEQQLDNNGLNLLFLYHISLINSVESGESLPNIVNDVKKAIEHDSLAIKQFDDALIKSGFLNIHVDRYSKIAYLIRSNKVYKVEGDFPRIIGQNLLNGVGDVRYSINVSECQHYIVPDEVFIKYIGV